MPLFYMCAFSLKLKTCFKLFLKRCYLPGKIECSEMKCVAFQAIRKGNFFWMDQLILMCSVKFLSEFCLQIASWNLFHRRGTLCSTTNEVSERLRVLCKCSPSSVVAWNARFVPTCLALPFRVSSQRVSFVELAKPVGAVVAASRAEWLSCMTNHKSGGTDSSFLPSRSDA